MSERSDALKAAIDRVLNEPPIGCTSTSMENSSDISLKDLIFAINNINYRLDDYDRKIGLIYDLLKNLIIEEFNNYRK